MRCDVVLSVCPTALNCGVIDAPGREVDGEADGPLSKRAAAPPAQTPEVSSNVTTTEGGWDHTACTRPNMSSSREQLRVHHNSSSCRALSTQRDGNAWTTSETWLKSRRPDSVWSQDIGTPGTSKSGPRA